MKESLRRLFWPVLKTFESGEGDFSYRESHRKILFAVGGLFLLLALGSLYASIKAATYGGLFPGAIFLSIGVVSTLVASLGSNRAVAKIWRNR
ncbi:MAG: hypothetical protein U5K56_10645 [Halioglobus sp.]|nr:hypothetical protein [Halioglobus sp.]